MKLAACLLRRIEVKAGGAIPVGDHPGRGPPWFCDPLQIDGQDALERVTVVAPRSVSLSETPLQGRCRDLATPPARPFLRPHRAGLSSARRD